MKRTPTPRDARHLFKLGFDTVEIGRFLRVPEAEAQRLLRVGREIERDPVGSEAASVSEPSVAVQPDRRASHERVSDVARNDAMGDQGAGEKRED